MGSRSSTINKGYSTQGVAVPGGNTNPTSLSASDGFGGTTTELVDLDGDGFMDSVTSSTSGWTWRKGHGLTQPFDVAQAWPFAAGTPLAAIRGVEVTPPNCIVPNCSVQTRNDLIDMDGDGLADEFSYVGGTVLWYRNTGSGFAASQSWGGIPAGPNRLSNTSKTLQSDGLGNQFFQTLTTSLMTDFDGDGCTDRLSVTSGGGGTWVWNFSRNLKCDPIPVAAFSTTTITWPSGTVPPPYLTRTRTESVAPSTGQNPGLQDFTTAGLIDVNGDGLIDFFTTPTSSPDSGAGMFILGTGRGFASEVSTTYTASWAAAAAAGIGSSSGMLSNSLRQGLLTSLTDVNGDGRPDLVVSDTNLASYLFSDEGQPPANCHSVFDASYTSHETWAVVLNTGSGFDTSNILSWFAATPSAPGSPNPYLDFGFLQESSGGSLQCDGVNTKIIHGSTRLADFDGSGSADFIQVSFGNWTVFKNPGPKPELLTRAQNGFGGSTTVTWTTAFGANTSSLPGSANGRFPVNVVSSIVTTDGINTTGSTQTTYTKTFTYADMFFDGAKRMFRGFRKVTTNVGDNLGTPPATDVHSFNVGDGSFHTIPMGSGAVPGSLCRDNPWTDVPALAGYEFEVDSSSGGKVLRAPVDENATGLKTT